ncbi:MAG TPA: hypothetical protein EYH43_01920 [Persephonella sp.]|nr:hypothetical protein [Hydrogenothermaceae bacterium]HIQ24725.1 hypothetical protein [Persephonella sp.]
MRAISILAILFGIVCFIQVISGIYLFFVKYPIETLNQPLNKSLLGVVEVAFPHFLAISLTVFIILHLFYFFKVNLKVFIFAFIFFVSGILNIISNFLIVYISTKFYILKLLSFLAFEICFVIACVWIIFLFTKRLT